MPILKKGILSLLLPLCFPLTAFSLPAQITPPGERMVLVDPNAQEWGAYNAQGILIRSGRASAGADWCEDMNSPCKTEIGSFRVSSLGDSSCKSPSFPIPTGGSPMPYCMYFNKYQALHGSYHVGPGNISHGCIRMHVSDAKWLRNNFVKRGTLVVIQSY
jgi:hypothetical protein